MFDEDSKHYHAVTFSRKTCLPWFERPLPLVVVTLIFFVQVSDCDQTLGKLLSQSHNCLGISSQFIRAKLPHCCWLVLTMTCPIFANKAHKSAAFCI